MRRFASVKTIAEFLNITKEEATEIRGIVKAAGRRRHAEDAMGESNKIMEAYGVESMRSPKHWIEFWLDSKYVYINTGDTHNPTIAYDCVGDRFILTTLGDIAEGDKSLI